MKIVAVLLLVVAAAFGQASETSNQDVITMTRAGLSPSIIAAKISSTPCRFDTSISGLTALKSAGVDDSVVAAMINCRPPKAAHDVPYVWIGANEEWVARSRAAVVATDTSSSTVITGGERTTVQTHSEYSDVARSLSSCHGVVITNNPNDADYGITIERYNAGHLLTQRNSFSVFRAKDGKLLLSSKTTWLKNATGDMCNAILQDIAPPAKTAETSNVK